jgi:hypothetical protein
MHLSIPKIVRNSSTRILVLENSLFVLMGDILGYDTKKSSASGLKMEAVGFSKMLVYNKKNTWHDIFDAHHLFSYCCENLKSHESVTTWHFFP